MKEVFLLWFTCVDERLIKGEDEILIGIYSSNEKALDAKTRFENLNGFKDFKDGFEISSAIVDEDRWKGGFSIV